MHTMIQSNPITFCISTYNNLPYLKLAIQSVRKNSFYKTAPFIVHAENCTDGTNEWLSENKDTYNLTLLVEPESIKVRGIGGGMNFCADHVETEYIMFLHSDFYVSENWDINLLKIFEKYPDEKMWISSHRIEPNIFGNSASRPGTMIIDTDIWGAYHNNFNSNEFERYANEFIQLNSDFEIAKGEGVSGLIRKCDWDEIGGNDPQFAPASWDDMDLFLRMHQAGFKFILTGSSVVWHFGARGSHRLEENNGKTSERQRMSEHHNLHKFLQKWKGIPKYNEVGMIIGVEHE